MEPAHLIEFDITDDYLRRSTRSIAVHHFIRSLAIWFIAAGIVLGLAYLSFGDLQTAGILFVGTALALALRVIAVVQQSQRVLEFFSAFSHRRQIVRFYGDRIEDESAEGTLTIPWRFIIKVCHLRRVWVLFFSRANFLMLPAERLDSDLRAFIVRHCAHGNREDFLRCGKCSNSLIGCAQRLCPRCQSPLPFERMQLSPERFYELSTALAAGFVSKLPKPRVQIVRTGYFLSAWKVVILGGAFGLLAFVVLIAVVETIATTIAVMAVMLGIPTLAMLTLGPRIRLARGVLLFALFYGLVMDAMFLALVLFGGTASPTLTPAQLALLFISLPFASTAWIWLSWAVTPWFRGRAVHAEAFRCAVCAYQLVGNISGSCPECGTPIPFEQLGISPEQFGQLAARMAGGDETKPTVPAAPPMVMSNDPESGDALDSKPSDLE